MKKLILLLALLALPAVACPAAGDAPPQGGPPAAAEARPPQKGAADRFMDLYIPQLFVLMAALCAASEAASRKSPAAVCPIKKAWNWSLLATFLACAAIGFVLLFPLDKGVKTLLFRLHIWTGVFCTWAGGYHAVKRFRTMC